MMSNKLKKPERRPTPMAGQVHFRLLCTTQAAGGLIGHGGSIIKALERETTSKIHVDLATSSASKDRLVHIIGSASVDRTLHLADGCTMSVSAAQEALVRVFERMVEVEIEASGAGGGGGAGGTVKCCMLAGARMVGAVIGKGGERISKVIQESKAHIKVFRPKIQPHCAHPSDEFIQISGDILAVKKALVFVSQHLHNKAEIKRGAHDSTTSTTYSPLPDQTTLHTNTINAPLVNNASNGVLVKVGFKLLCPYRAAGSVIGTRGRRVKSLEEETKSSICFFAAEPCNRERVVTLSAMESRELQDSYAQSAVMRVFHEIVSSDRDTTTARLLLLPHLCDWLNEGENSIALSIQKATGATFQFLELDYAPSGAAAGEKVIQIDGEYPDVEVALFQLTSRLRERFLGIPLSNHTPLLPHKLFSNPQKNRISKLMDGMNNCRVSEESNGSHPRISSHTQINKGHCQTTTTGSSSNLATVKDGSEKRGSVTITKTTVEIAVHEDVFGGVYGENGGNLARLQLISGATVEVHDPTPGGEGTVIISGTRDQTLVAQSLLQAFLMSAP